MTREGAENCIEDLSTSFCSEGDLYKDLGLSDSSKRQSQEGLEYLGDSVLNLLDSMYFEGSTDFPEQENRRVPILSHPKKGRKAGLENIDNLEHEFNPFIPQLKGKSGTYSFLPESMIPELPPMPIHDSPYRNIIQDAARKQKAAQLLFRGMSTPPASPISRSSIGSPSFRTRASPISPASGNSSPISPMGRNYKGIPKRGNSLLPSENSIIQSFTSSVGDSISKSPTSPPARDRNLSPLQNEARARQERLSSLGIFEVSPISKSMTSDVIRTTLNSFSTPAHQKPDKMTDIYEITSPQLISTSSRMQTVPLTEIIKDLKAAGRLIDEDVSGKQLKKKNYFSRKG